jgi:hypothetical protein
LLVATLEAEEEEESEEDSELRRLLRTVPM